MGHDPRVGPLDAGGQLTLVYRAHPAVGLVLADGPTEELQAVPEDHFGPGWTNLGDDEQDRLLQRFFERVLEFLSGLCPATVTAEVVLRADRQRIAAAGAKDQAGGRFVLPLTRDVTGLLPELSIVWMRVSCSGSLLLELRDSWEGVLLFLDDRTAGRLRASLP